MKIFLLQKRQKHNFIFLRGFAVKLEILLRNSCTVCEIPACPTVFDFLCYELTRSRTLSVHRDVYVEFSHQRRKVCGSNCGSRLTNYLIACIITSVCCLHNEEPKLRLF